MPFSSWRGVVSERNCFEHEPANAIENCIEDELHYEPGQKIEQHLKHDYMTPNVQVQRRCAALSRSVLWNDGSATYLCATGMAQDVLPQHTIHARLPAFAR